jgi:hypothetical protein
MRYLKYTMTEFRPEASQMRVPLQVHAFRKLLVQETDETKGQMLFLLLAQEEAKLKAQLRALAPNAAGSPLVQSRRLPKFAIGREFPIDRVANPLATLRFQR